MCQKPQIERQSTDVRQRKEAGEEKAIQWKQKFIHEESGLIK